MPNSKSLWPFLPLLSLLGCDCTNGGDNNTQVCTGRSPGDLVVTEVLSDPNGTDTGSEWFEIFNTLGTDVDLTGMTVYTKKTDGTGLKSHLVRAGKAASRGYFTFGDVRMGALPSYIGYSYGSDLGALGQSSGVVGIRCKDTVLDEFTWTSAAKAGHARQFNGKLTPDATANDDEANWCDAPNLYDGTNFGSPGQPNPECVPAAMAGDVRRGRGAATHRHPCDGRPRHHRGDGQPARGGRHRRRVGGGLRAERLRPERRGAQHRQRHQHPEGHQLHSPGAGRVGSAGEGPRRGGERRAQQRARHLHLQLAQLGGRPHAPAAGRGGDRLGVAAGGARRQVVAARLRRHRPQRQRRRGQLLPRHRAVRRPRRRRPRHARRGELALPAADQPRRLLRHRHPGDAPDSPAQRGRPRPLRVDGRPQGGWPTPPASGWR